jgi:hypothetical protein
VRTHTDAMARAQDHLLNSLRRTQMPSVGVLEAAGRMAPGATAARLLTTRIGSGLPLNRSSS